MTMDKGVVTKKVVNGTAKRTHPFVAQLFPLLAAAVQLALWPKVRPLFWLFFYPAVFFSSWIGGLAGGISATALSILLVIFFFVPPELSFAIRDRRDLISAGVFLCMGILFSMFHDRLKRASRKRDAALAAADTARGELETRVQERTRELIESNELLQKSEERLRLLISGVEDCAIFTKDLRGDRNNMESGSGADVWLLGRRDRGAPGSDAGSRR